MVHWIDRLAQWWLDLRTDYAIKHNPPFDPLKFTRAEISSDGFLSEFVSPSIALLADQARGVILFNIA